MEPLENQNDTLCLEYPGISKAVAILGEAEQRNPGPWVSHSYHVAKAAEIIAAHLPGIDPQLSFVLGLLHDIGRREGVTGMRHALDGYRYLEKCGCPGPARISITHSYPNKTAAEGSSKWDGTQEEYAIVQDYLDRIEYTLYDRLIQLCDSLALPTGFCLLEQRLVDVVLRYGFNPYTLPKWRAFFQIKDDIEQTIGGSIYDLLPGIVRYSHADHNNESLTPRPIHEV